MLEINWGGGDIPKMMRDSTARWSKLAAGEQNNFITMAKVNYKKYYGMYIIKQTI
jgi:hypothetical protein